MTALNVQNSGYVEVWNRYLGRNVRVEPRLAYLVDSLLRRYPIQHCYETPEKGLVSLVFDAENSAEAFAAAYIGWMKVTPLSGEKYETFTGKVVAPGQSSGISRKFHFVDFPVNNVDAVIRMIDGFQTAA